MVYGSLADDGASVQEVLSEITNQKTVPNIFVNKVHVGGCDRTLQAHQNGLLQKLLQEDTHDYDLIVIGGGSGGLSCAKEAAILGKKVMVLDFVVPSPQGSSWGLGGTCVNVGCIPKKLMHQAALLGQALQDSRKFGWDYSQQVKHNWEAMTEAIQNHISSLNWGYRLSLREKGVAYVNSYGEFVEPHKIKATNKKGQENYYTAAKFVIATGERPRYLGIAGDKEHCVTSDDLFSLPHCPGKTLVVGASYVALECAGFLAGFGLDVTVMVRSVLLRGFDQEMAEKVGSYMEQHGVKFLRKFIPVMVYHTLFWPLEWTVAGRDNNTCYAKIICNKFDSDRVVGFHVLGPNAGEITQGFAAAMKCGLTKQLLSDTIGIHPTCGEVFTTLEITKSSGLDITQKGC
ncbi:thioredoxin reductase 3-like [Castor canadensis]|uniref:Thioredoxin reductase 3-like n=1 Tax=Castor canadensis TaxID=51338 RepID=A0AC58K6Y0_CASCN